VASGAVETGLGVAPNATLDVQGAIFSSAAVTVGLGGTVNLNAPQYFNTGMAAYFTIDGGTVTAPTRWPRSSSTTSAALRRPP
jgi:hypothetical protein